MDSRRRVRAIARNSPSDDGLRSYLEGIRTLMDKYYPDWRDPQGTTVIARKGFSTSKKAGRGQDAEKRVFHLLENTGEPMFVVYSFEFNEKTRNGVFKGEHDFVVIHRQHGLIFFQVKARNVFGGEYYDARSQLEKDVQSVAGYLAMFPYEGDVSCRGFAVMPNCPRPQNRDVAGVFQEDCQDDAAFRAWWHSQISSTATEVSQELYEYLLARLVRLKIL